jgi:hypothetical protein
MATMRKVITNRLLETVKSTAKRDEIRDATFAGFGVRITANGRKTFVYNYRWGLKQRRETLGTYPATSLVRAREKAVAIQRLVEEGVDPTAKRRATIVMVEEAVADFIRSYAKPRNKSWQEADRTLTRELTSVYGQRDVRSITRADLLDIVDAASARGALYQANRIHAHVRKFFNWCAQRGIVDANPLLGIAMPSRERARDRGYWRTTRSPASSALHAPSHSRLDPISAAACHRSASRRDGRDALEPDRSRCRDMGDTRAPVEERQAEPCAAQPVRHEGAKPDPPVRELRSGILDQPAHPDQRLHEDVTTPVGGIGYVGLAPA